MDGNTRLCTATAAAALKESFACDGQPGSYTDIDHADVMLMNALLHEILRNGSGGVSMEEICRLSPCLSEAAR